MAIIFHIALASDWKEAREKGFYEHPTLRSEGFIHCSQDNQVASVLERYFAGQTDLLKLSIETDKLTSKFIFDWSPSTAETYPHVYGPINIDAVVEAIAL